MAPTARAELTFGALRRRDGGAQSPGRGSRWPCIALLLIVVACPSGRAAAQSGETTVSAVLVPEQGAGMPEVAVVSIGLRRGVDTVQGMRFVHAADAMSQQRMSDEAAQALDELDGIAEMVRRGDADAASASVEGAIAAFENDLANVARGQLVDAYMLRALAECQRRRLRECREGFEYVVTFREGQEYDAERYPARHQALFDEVRDRLVADGVRGAVEIATEPEGAEVFVDGRSLGASPTTAEGLLVGMHYVTVKAVGYDKVVSRVEVNPSYQETVHLELDRSERALLMERDLPRIRSEMGADRAGPFIRGLRGYLYTQQVIVGAVRLAPGGSLDVQLFLYHLQTRHLLSQKHRVVPPGSPGIVAVEQMAIELYEGVDIQGTIAAPVDDLDLGESTPFWQKWWFWTAVGVVAASGVAAIFFLGQTEGPAVPEGWTRVGIEY